MAIGGLISNRNFGHSIGSGKVCRGEQAILFHRGERSALVAAHGNLFYQKLWSRADVGFVSGNSCGLFPPRTTVHLDGNFVKPMSVSPNGRRLISSTSPHHSETFPSQRSSGSFACHCFSGSPRGWLGPGDKDKRGENRTCALYNKLQKVSTKHLNFRDSI